MFLGRRGIAAGGSPALPPGHDRRGMGGLGAGVALIYRGYPSRLPLPRGEVLGVAFAGGGAGLLSGRSPVAGHG